MRHDGAWGHWPRRARRPERHPGQRTWTLIGVLLASLLVLGSACTQEFDRDTGSVGPIGTGEIALVRADDCTTLADAVSEREQAIRRMQQAIDERMPGGDSNAAGSATAEAAGPPLSTASPRFASPQSAADATTSGSAATDKSSGSAGSGSSEATAAGDGSVIAGTNLQEVGVDEGDMVKTDGRRLVVLTSDGTLRVVLLGDRPTMAGSVRVLETPDRGVGDKVAYPGPATGGQLLLRGDEAVAIIPSFTPADGTPLITLARVDLSDPGSPKIVERVDVAGELVATRMAASKDTDTTPRIRIVMRPFDQSTVRPEPFPIEEPPIDPPMPTTPPVTSAPDTIPATTVPDTVPGTRPTTTTAAPTTTTTTTSTTTTTTVEASRPRESEPMTAQVRALLPQEVTADGTARTIGGCSDVFVEPVPVPTPARDVAVAVAPASQGQNVSVLTVGDSLADLSPVTVVGGADTAYATADALYTTANVWGAGPGGQGATAVHRFELTGTGPARYTGSGLVPGTVLDQYSMSERRGALRIVTTATATATTTATTAAPRGRVSGPSTVEPSGPDSPVVGPAEDVMPVSPEVMPVSRPAGRLTVLRPDESGTLREVGRLEDVGVGEEVKSVRFLDDRAYVVTFRRTDPLFAIDVSNDTAPKVLGELKLPGFSQYLHPIGDGRLLGIGSDADPQTGRPTGFKATIFDVSNPTAPKELDSFVRPGVSTIVSSDPHAFTWDPVRSQAVVPASSTAMGGCPPGAACAVAGPAVDTVGGIAAEPDAIATEPASPWSGAYVLGVDGDHLTLRGSLAHDIEGRTAQILRSVVVDSAIWTVSDAAVGRTDATSPTSIALKGF